MREFIRGWRRKAGVVTLMLALTMVVGWIRSFASANEHIRITSQHSIYSHNGSVSWNVRRANPSGQFVMKSTTAWRWEWCGLVATELKTVGNTTLWQYWASWWYFIIPLTILSAWLLLSKPRAKPSIADPAGIPN